MEIKPSIIIPACNEEGNIGLLLKKLSEELRRYSAHEVIVIDDGSTDDTAAVVKSAIESDPNVKLISFSRNFGHQSALKAGIDYATGDCVISMDADLQHPPELLHRMIEVWQSGFDVVYTVRKDSKDISAFKRITSRWFYKLLNRLSDVSLEQGSADFRLISRQVADYLKLNLNEYHLFYRGLIAWIGFRQFAIPYTPDSRHSGKTKYSLRKMIGFSLNGITSFSIKPLRLAIMLGLCITGISVLYAAYALYVHFFTNQAIQGWTSVILSVLFIGGVQLIIMGIIGEYVGKTYFEVKKRPHYVIKELIR